MVGGHRCPLLPQYVSTGRRGGELQKIGEKASTAVPSDSEESDIDEKPADSAIEAKQEQSVDDAKAEIKA